ncbi:MAG: hypothetical protein ABEK16_01215 [Candidatus Nanohalobium sp.]
MKGPREELSEFIREKKASWVYRPDGNSSILGGFSQVYGAVDEIITEKPEREGSSFNNIPVSKITNQEIQHYLGKTSQYTGSLNEALENHGYAGIWDAETEDMTRVWGLTRNEVRDIENKIVSAIDTSL